MTTEFVDDANIGVEDEDDLEPVEELLEVRVHTDYHNLFARVRKSDMVRVESLLRELDKG